MLVAGTRACSQRLLRSKGALCLRSEASSTRISHPGFVAQKERLRPRLPFPVSTGAGMRLPGVWLRWGVERAPSEDSRMCMGAMPGTG
jgi:hypothetical protein